MITIVVRALVTVPKNLEKRLDELEIGEKIETTQTTALLISSRILIEIRVLETRGDLLSLRLKKSSCEKLSQSKNNKLLFSLVA